MKKRILSLALILAMMLSLIPFGVMTASAADDTIIGITWTGDGYKVLSNGIYLNTTNPKIHTASGTTVSISGGTGALYIDEDFNVQLETEPVLGEIYYFDAWIWDSGMEQNITNANSTIQYTGFSNGKVLSAKKASDGDIQVICSIMYGELTGGVKAIASGVEYDSALGGYAPTFTTLKCVSTEGNVLEPTMVSGKYSYYGADSDCLYKTYSGVTFSDKLTTEPQVGETYYSSFSLDSMDGNLHIEEELLDIQIPGYKVEFVEAYERDMGFTSRVVYSVTKTPPVYVGGVGMFDGDYLAVGATATQTTKPSGGYAYYNDGVLTLNNYSYEGAGYYYDEYYAVIYANQDLTVYLIGTNTLVQTKDNSDSIYANHGSLTIDGNGSLTNTDTGYGLWADNDVIINGGTIVTTGGYNGIHSGNADVIINGGNVTAKSNNVFGIYARIDVIINGGNVTAIGGYFAIYNNTGDFTVADGLRIQASKTVDGALGEYVAEDNNTYKKIVITPADVYVGGVGMFDGDYLAVGATATTTTKPSGGYAYYNDGVLTLNNYSYEGYGYYYGEYYAVIYADNSLTVELRGVNTLVQTESESDSIYSKNGPLVIEGNGSLTSTDRGYAIWSDNDVIINGGTIVTTGGYNGIRSEYADVIINGGDITATGNSGISAQEGSVIVNGGNVVAKTNHTDNLAVRTSNGLTVTGGATIQASTEVDGELGEYVAHNLGIYKKIVITENSGTLGDVDDDGDVDAADYVLVKRAVLKTYTLSEQQNVVADIDADGDVDATDYVLVKRIVLGTYKVK